MLSPDSIFPTAVACVALLAVVAVAWRRGWSVTHGAGERVLGRLWPDLWRLRRALLPRLERIAPGVKFVIPVRDAERVGVVDTPVGALRERLRAAPDVYPNNAAGLKRAEGEWEAGSYAWRDGLFGRDQVHIRLVPHGDGRTLVLAHHEVAPLGGVGEGLGAVLRVARRHYRGVTLDDERGVARARALLRGLGVGVSADET